MIVGTFTALFNKSGELLIARRAKNKKIAGGKWNLIGGKVEPGETPEEGAKREIEEESAIHVLKEVLYPLEVSLRDYEHTSFECHVFIAKTNDQEIMINEEHSEFLFISEKEIDNIEIAWFNKEEIKSILKKYKEIEIFI